MPINPSWYSNGTGDPFRDNTDGSITAETLRNFVGELRDNGVAENWCKYRSESIDAASYDWSSVDTPVAIAVTTTSLAALPTFSGSINWTYSMSELVGSPSWALVSYTGFSSNSLNTNVVLDFSFQSTIAFPDPNWGTFGPFTNLTVGTSVQPIVFVGSSEASGSVYRILGETVVEGTDTFVRLQDNTFRTYYSGSSAPVIKVGVLFTPPSGEAVEASPGDVDVDLSNLEVRIAARTISPLD